MGIITATRHARSVMLRIRLFGLGTGMSSDEILEKSALPVKLAGISHCFRSERAHGSATRGIYRVHQFTKTEMVIVCTEQQAVEMHMKLRAIEQRVFDGLGIPYRVLEIATGDLGASAYRKFDLEAWMPGRNGGSWGEITSTSNCTDFQARRLNIRYRDEDGKLKFVYTLNGTAIDYFVADKIINITSNMDLYAVFGMFGHNFAAD
jgi:seryl-tRNA synthetase